MKRKKIGIASSVALSAVAIVLAFTLSSCTKEPIDGGRKESPAGMIYIDFSDSDSPTDTRAGELQSSEEKQVAHADIFFYGAANGANKDKLIKRISVAGSSIVDSKVAVPSTEIDLNLAYKIVVVANGATSWADDLPIGSPIDDLNAKITAITDISSLQTPLLMSGVVDSHVFATDPIVNIDLIRQVVKLNITVKLSREFTGNYPLADFGGSYQNMMETMWVFNLPSQSYIINNNTSLPANSTMLYKEKPWGDVITSFTIYAYANPVMGNDAAARKGSTRFIFRMPYRLDPKSEIVTENYYAIYINDANSPENPHKTLRNNVYDIAVTITGFGSETPPDFPDGIGMTVTTNVLPWNSIWRDDYVGSHAHLDEAVFRSTTSTSFATLPEGGNIPEDGGTLRLDCYTDVGGLYVILRDHGKIVKNTKSTPTPIVNLWEAQNIEMEIPKLDYLDHRYTVSIHHPIYATELINQVTFSFTQYGGFIPNSELLKGLTISGKLEQWPADKLPPRGLQIAKTGNVLPTEAAKTDKPEVPWSTRTSSVLIGTTKVDFGSGKSNYMQLNALPASEYPIGQACAHLGPEWYVPSRNELIIIHETRLLTLGSSYVFDESAASPYVNYWSSSESEVPNYSYYVGFGDGPWGKQTSKGSLFRVRCVRDI